MRQTEWTVVFIRQDDQIYVYLRNVHSSTCHLLRKAANEIGVEPGPTIFIIMISPEGFDRENVQAY